jgi:hypothetical protein
MAATSDGASLGNGTTTILIKTPRGSASGTSRAVKPAGVARLVLPRAGLALVLCSLCALTGLTVLHVHFSKPVVTLYGVRDGIWGRMGPASNRDLSSSLPKAGTKDQSNNAQWEPGGLTPQLLHDSALYEAVKGVHPLNRLECGSWPEKYARLHHDILSGVAPQRYTVMRSRQEFGNGLADRLATSVTIFMYAILTNRAFQYDWDPPPGVGRRCTGTVPISKLHSLRSWHLKFMARVASEEGFLTVFLLHAHSNRLSCASNLGTSCAPFAPLGDMAAQAKLQEDVYGRLMFFEPPSPLWDALRSDFIDWRYTAPDLGNTSVVMDYNCDKDVDVYKALFTHEVSLQRR